MPSNIVKSFADKTGKSESEVEKMWDQAKAAASEEYPEVAKDSDRYYAIVTGILKKMLGLKESFSDLIDAEKENLKILEAEMKKKKSMEDEEEDEMEDEGSEEDEMEDEEEVEEGKKKKK